MTYEDAHEAEVLQSFWRPDAPLENTLFVILDPYGRPLTRGTRSPGWFFRDARDMAEGMEEVAGHYRAAGDPHNLPVVSSVRLGLNVAACDKLPLAIVVADSPQQRAVLEERLAPLAWSDDLIGKMTYTTGTSGELRAVRGAGVSAGYVFVAPNEFGNEGAVMYQLGANASAGELASAMKASIGQYRPDHLDHREHIRLGREQGIHWSTAIPVTDAHALRAEQMP